MNKVQGLESFLPEIWVSYKACDLAPFRQIKDNDVFILHAAWEIKSDNTNSWQGTGGKMAFVP